MPLALPKVNLRETLQSAYHEVVDNNGILDMVCKLREGPRVNQLTRVAAKQVFDALPLWDYCGRGGHAAYKHKITGIVIGFQFHSENGETAIKVKQVASLLENLQLHVNVLGNDLFGYVHHNWKAEPDYEAIIERVTNKDKKHPKNEKESRKSNQCLVVKNEERSKTNNRK